MVYLPSKIKIKETTAMQIFGVFAWLWAVPVIDSFNSWSYGVATRAILTSFIALTLGLILSEKLPGKLGIFTLITGLAILLLSLVLFGQLRNVLGYWYLRHAALLRFIGFSLLGTGLKSMNFSMGVKSFAKGLICLILLYGFYNILIYSGNNIDPEMTALWIGRDIIYALTRIVIVVMLWQILSTDCIQQCLNKLPKISLLVAGLFWGMILVLPADSYSPRWLAIVMLVVAPIVAYIMTVIVRLSLSIISYLIKGFLENKFWWFESCCWWIDKGDYNKNTEK